MTTFRNAFALASHMRRRSQRVRRSLSIEMAELVELSRQDAIELTSGTVTEAELRAMGHPFGRRRPSPRARGLRRGPIRGNLPRLPINRHTGRLQRSLRVFRRGDQWQLQFTASYAKYVLAPGGTRNMVARGFWAEMRKRYQRRRGRLLEAKRRAETGG